MNLRARESCFDVISVRGVRGSRVAGAIRKSFSLKSILQSENRLAQGIEHINCIERQAGAGNRAMVR